MQQQDTLAASENKGQGFGKELSSLEWTKQVEVELQGDTSAQVERNTDMELRQKNQHWQLKLFSWTPYTEFSTV